MTIRNSVPLMMVPVLVGLWVSAFVPEPTVAQGCGWCEERRVWYIGFLKKKHHFPRGGVSCNWPPADYCARCGTGLGCHTEEDWGPCHIACGPAGEPPDEEIMALRDAVDEVRRALEAGDAGLAASSVLRDRAYLTVEYQAEAGRINFKMPCDPRVPAATVAVLPDIRPDFEAVLPVRTPGNLGA